MTVRLPRAALATCCATMVLLAAACSTPAEQQPGKTVTVTPSRSPSTPASTSTTASPTATRTLTKLPGTCDTMLPLSAVDDALGRAISGQTAFVVGTAEPDIGRLSYLNCRYGLPAGSARSTATPKVEIGVSLYKTAADAAKRIPATVDDYANHGASQADVTVEGTKATILTGASGDGYANPTIVAAAGQRTVAITIVEGAGAGATKDLSALAKLALQRTGG